MSRFISKKAKTFNKNEKGVTMLEYGLIAALVAVVAITGLSSLGSKLNTQFNNVASYLNATASK
jgi:pilus assembly protein Flp/PilA